MASLNNDAVPLKHEGISFNICSNPKGNYAKFGLGGQYWVPALLVFDDDGQRRTVGTGVTREVLIGKDGAKVCRAGKHIFLAVSPCPRLLVRRVLGVPHAAGTLLFHISSFGKN